MDDTEGGQQAVVVAALIGICDGLGLRAVAEGIAAYRPAGSSRQLTA